MQRAFLSFDKEEEEEKIFRVPIWLRSSLGPRENRENRERLIEGKNE